MFLVGLPQFQLSSVTNIQFIGVTVSTGETIQAHPNSLPGDVAILFDRGDQIGSIPNTYPSGFTRFVDDPGSSWNSKNVISGGLLTTGAGEVLTGLLSTDMSKILFTFRPNGKVNEVYLAAYERSLSNNDPSSTQADALFSSNRPPVALCFAAAGTSGSPALTPSNNITPPVNNVTTSNHLIAGYNIRPNPPSITSQRSDTNDRGGANIAIALILGIR